MERGIKLKSRAELEADRRAFARLVGRLRPLETAAGDAFTSRLVRVRLHGGHVARHYEIDLAAPDARALETRVQVNVSEDDDERIVREIVADLLEGQQAPPDLSSASVKNGDTPLHR